jgi:hypothetical protein
MVEKTVLVKHISGSINIGLAFQMQSSVAIFSVIFNDIITFAISDEQENRNQDQFGTETMKLWYKDVLNLHRSCSYKVM